MPYRDPVAALERKLSALRETRRELDASIASTRRQLQHYARPRWVDLTAVPAAVLAIRVPLILFGFLFVVWAALGPMESTCRRNPDEVRSHARMIRGAATLHFARTGDCPSVLDLVQVGILDPTFAPLTDPWGHPFRIECGDARIRVSSPGPDGVYGSDDIEIGR